MSAVPSWSVRRVGADRLRIDGEPAGSLLAWIRRHDAVAEVTVDRPKGAVEVVVRETHALAVLARTVEDRLFAAARRWARPIDVTVLHALPGRVRLGVTGLADRDVERLAEWLRSKAGVRQARPSPASGSIVVWFDSSQTSALEIVREVLASDPRSWPTTVPTEAGWAQALVNTGVLAASIALPGVLPAPLLGAAVACTAVPSVRRAALALREGRVGVDALDVVAIGISVATGRFATGALVTWLLGLGDLVLARTHARARRAITERLDLEAVDAHRLRGNVPEHVPSRALRPGDRIVVETGARIAADGVVESGAALVDERALTGESMPRARHRGDRVLSASVVVEGQIVVCVDRVGADTTAMRIAEILAGSGMKPMTLQRNAERVADRLVLPTFALAGASAALTAQLDRMTSVLITDFGTGLRIAVPTAALTAMTLAAREGVLVKGGQFLERLSRVDTIVFDKTGTLTCGEPDVVAIDVLGPLSAASYLGLAAAAEARQKHPIARAIRRCAERAGATASCAELGSETVSVGRGVSAVVDGHRVVVGGKRAMLEHGVRVGAARAITERHRSLGASSVLVAVDEQVAAVIAISDEPRAESAAVIDALREGGRRQVILLSGDARATTHAIGRALRVDRAEGELLPEDKARIVRELQSAGRTVAMVGDGINDAPALAIADVGISLEGSTDLALEAADVVLLEGGLSKLPRVFALADEGMANVKRSLWLVLAPNAVAIALGAVGLLPPALAAIVNNGSTAAAALAAVAPLFKRRAKGAG
jgi:Cu2+-exporting ATPase